MWVQWKMLHFVFHNVTLGLMSIKNLFLKSNKSLAAKLKNLFWENNKSLAAKDKLHLQYSYGLFFSRIRVKKNSKCE